MTPIRNKNENSVFSFSESLSIQHSQHDLLVFFLRPIVLSVCFISVFQNNKLLKTLLLGTNRFEDEGARLFKAAISDNTTLEVLDLSWNHFKTKGAIMLAEAIQVNTLLQPILYDSQSMFAI